MAYRKIDPETGFIEYIRTPEENSIIQMRQENAEMKAEIEKLKKQLSQSDKMIRRRDNLWVTIE